MKRILLLLCIISVNFINAQCVLNSSVLRSQADVDAFIAQYGNCTALTGDIYINEDDETPITDLSGFAGLTSVTGSIELNNVSATSLSGFEDLTTVTFNFLISNCEIQDVSALSNLRTVEKSLHITNNKITSLAPLNNLELVGNFAFFDNFDTLPEFDLQFNFNSVEDDIVLVLSPSCTHINGLSNITTVGGTVGIEGDGIINLSGLQNLTTVGNALSLLRMPVTSIASLGHLTSVGGYLTLESLNITSLEGLDNLTSIGYGLDLSYNYQLADISALIGMTELDSCTIFGSVIQSLNGLQNITSMGSVYLKQNTSLTDISALINVGSSLNQIFIQENPLLAVCEEEWVCNFINAGNPYSTYIQNNAAGCNSRDEVFFACNSTTVNSLSGTVRFNHDNDECAESIYTAANILIKATSLTGEEYMTFTKDNGTYRFFMPEGEYSIEAIEDLTNFEVSAPSTVSFTGFGNDISTDFCLSAIAEISDVRISIYPAFPSRPGFDTSYFVVCENLGTVTRSGTASLQYNTDKLSYLYSSTRPDASGEGLLSWNYTGLRPFQEVRFEVNFNVLAPPVNEIDQVLALSGAVTLDGADVNEEDNSTSLEQVLVGSYDPNDKNVAEGNEVNIEDADNYLTYKIRFQNTGSASAIRVRLEDQLDEKLDWSTLKPVAASHSYRIAANNGQLVINFDNINLPAQVMDDAGSNGFFMYKIKPLNTVAVGDMISNTAEIYFDFNTPIVTNTVSTTFVEEIAGIDVYSFDVTLYPNPAQSIINIKGKLPVTFVDLYNSIGQHVIKMSDNSGIGSFNITNLANGVYVCHIKNANGEIAVRKIIISK